MARPSSVPVFPKKSATTLLVAVATLMFGMAIVITRGLLSGVRVPAAVEREPMRRSMPVAPVLPGLRRAPELAATAEPPQRAAMSAFGAAMPAFDSPEAIADRLRAMRAQALSGTRSLVAGDITTGQLAVEAASLGKALAAKGQTVILIDWAPAGGGIAEALGHQSVPGMLDLVAGRVKFEDVVGALGHSGAHLIPAGSSLGVGEIIDPNHVNFVLDALDGVYDQIIVASREEAARHLFEAIEGRFDCGITLVSGEGAPLLVEAQTFLGYEVDGIELMRYAVPASFGKASGRAAHLTRQEPRMRVG
jgi:hypothetical protein